MIFIGSAAAGTYGYYVLIPKEIESKVTQGLQNLGFKKVTYESVIRKKGKLTLYNVMLDTKSFSGIESISVKYSLWNYIFGHRKADSVIVKNLKLTGDISNALNLNIAGWKNDGLLLSTLTQLPTQSIRFENSSIEVLAPVFGGLNFQYSGELKQNSAQEILITGTLNTSQKKLEAEARLFGSINSRGNLEIQAQTDDLQVDIDGLNIKRASLYGTMIAFSGNVPHLSLELNAGSLVWKNLPLRETNVTFEKKSDILQIYAEGRTAGAKNTEFSGQIGFMKDILAFELTVYPENARDLLNYFTNAAYIKADTHIPDILLDIKKPTLSIEGKTADKHGNVDGIIKFTALEPDFEVTGDFSHKNDDKNIRGNLYLPRTFIPYYNSKPDENNLALSSNGYFNYNYATDPIYMDWQLESKIDKSKLTFNSLSIEDLEGRFIIGNDQEGPIETRQKTIAFKLPLKITSPHSGEIMINSMPDKNITIDSLAYKIFGGSVEAKHIDLEHGSLPDKFTLELEEINLSEFIKTLGVEGLALIGKAAGKIPLEKQNQKFIIRKGLLQSQQSGIFTMPEKVSLEYFPDDDEKSKNTRLALQNFHYEYFEIRIDGELNGPVMLSFLAKGINPDARNEEGSITIDFNLESSLEHVFKNIVH